MTAALARRGGSAGGARRRLAVTGARLDRGFVAFVEARARLLSLDLAVERADAGRVTMAVAGPAHLIDMLEMAALLGPLDARVDAIAMSEDGATCGATDEATDEATDGMDRRADFV